MPPTPTPVPSNDRVIQYKYRFGQSVVFGIPVIALHFFARKLGPEDWERWGSLLQALLAGWVVYVNLGMLVEAAMIKRLTVDAVITAIAVTLYLYSIISAAHGIVTARLLYPLMFHVSVILLAAWSLWRWMRLRSTT